MIICDGPKLITKATKHYPLEILVAEESFGKQGEFSAKALFLLIIVVLLFYVLDGT